MDIRNKLKEVLSTITEETQSLVIKKSEESGFDINRGDIPLTESFQNLNDSKDILEDALEKDKLSQLPLSVQKRILSHLESANLFMTSSLCF